MRWIYSCDACRYEANCDKITCIQEEIDKDNDWVDGYE